eukprot:Skav210825  [mRNA]  locus=scaffold1597:363685:364263:- [translate_table: standard]
MVSSHGRIRSKNGIISFGYQRKDRYRATMILESSQLRVEQVHRLVAYTFRGPPPTLEHTQVNHKDGNRSHNSVENLEWVTPAENNAHAIANLKGPHFNCKPVLSRACGSHDEWRHHASTTKAAEELGLHQQLVSNCARGKQKHTGGYEFRFVETEEEPDQDLPDEEWRDVDLKLLLQDRKPRRRKSSKKKSG